MSSGDAVSLDNKMREGKIERTLHGHLTGHPDEAFSTDELCYGLSGV